MEIVGLDYVPLGKEKLSWDFYILVGMLEYTVISTLPPCPPSLHLYQRMLFRCKFQEIRMDTIMLLENIVDHGDHLELVQGVAKCPLD